MRFLFSTSKTPAGPVGESAGFSYDGAARQLSRGLILSAGVVASLAVAIAVTASSLDTRPSPPTIFATSVPLAHDHAPGHLDGEGRS